MQEKNNLISFLQAFGILLVVVGHSRQGTSSPLLWYIWIYSFHMPLFMFISGFLWGYGSEKKHVPLSAQPLYGRKGFIWKKVKRLLIPYVAISTLAFLPKALLNRFAVRPVEVSFESFFHQLVYPGDNVIVYFWFLPTLFVIFLMVMYGVRLFRHFDSREGHAAVLLVALLLHLFNPAAGIRLLNLGGVIGYLFYFLLGYYCCRYHVEDRLAGNSYVGLGATLLLSVAFVTFIPSFPGKDVLTACNGIALSIFLGKVYLVRRAGFLDHLYGASYAIYLFSFFPQAVFQQVFLGITHAPWQVGAVLAAVTGVYVPWLIYKWIVKHRTERVGRCVAYLTGHS